jgi:hypothetical protein
MAEALRKWREDETRALAYKAEHGHWPSWFTSRTRKASHEPVGERALLERLENEWWEDTGKPALKAAYSDER